MSGTISELQVSSVPQSSVLVKGPTYPNSNFPYSHSRITSHTLNFLYNLISNNDTSMKDNKTKYVSQPKLGTTLNEVNSKMENPNELDISSPQESTNRSIYNLTYSPHLFLLLFNPQN